MKENYKDLTGDKSAMDAIIRFEDEQGKKGFIAIETKYSENLGTNAADKNGEYYIAEIRACRNEVQQPSASMLWPPQEQYKVCSGFGYYLDGLEYGEL